MLSKLQVLFGGDRVARMKIVRYLLVGGFNTAFGYFFTVGLYYMLQSHLHIVAISLMSNVVCITVSFIMYKLFVFMSPNSWWQEYLRCYVVYGGSALIGIAGLWLLVDFFDIPFWLAQGMLMVISVVISFAGHDRFTFKKVQGG